MYQVDTQFKNCMVRCTDNEMKIQESQDDDKEKVSIKYEMDKQPNRGKRIMMMTKNEFCSIRIILRPVCFNKTCFIKVWIRPIKHKGGSPILLVISNDVENLFQTSLAQQCQLLRHTCHRHKDVSSSKLNNPSQDSNQALIVVGMLHVQL